MSIENCTLFSFDAIKVNLNTNMVHARVCRLLEKVHRCFIIKKGTDVFFTIKCIVQDRDSALFSGQVKLKV